MRIYNFYKNLLIENGFWIKSVAYWALLWLAVGGLISFLNPGLAEPFLSFIEDLYQPIIGKTNELNLELAINIFFNNLRAAILVLFTGIIFGLVPIFAIAFNSFIVGFLLVIFFRASFLGGLFLTLSLIPHGIFELSAIIFAAAFGLRLGYFWVKAPEKNSLASKIKNRFLDNLFLIPFLTVGLFLAAFIEVFISGRLLSFISTYFPL